VDGEVATSERTTVLSTQLNVVKELERTFQSVSLRRNRHLTGL